MAHALDRPHRVIETGRVDADAEQWVVGALRQWAAQAPEDGKALLLHRFLGLSTPRAYQIYCRNRLLGTAFALFDGGMWTRATRIAEAARAFETRRWPIWRRADGPPPDAAEIDRILWQCRSQYGMLPSTAQAYSDIADEHLTKVD